MESLLLGYGAFVLRRAGRAFGSRARREPHASLVVVPVESLTRITVSVEDLDRSLALYRDALGLLERYREGDVAMLAVAGGGGGPQVLLHRRTPQPSVAGVAASLRVDDVDRMTEAAVAAGARVLDAPADQPWGERQSVLTDVDGHVLCLVSAIRAASDS